MNVFVKPNEQSQVCLSYAMANKGRMKFKLFLKSLILIALTCLPCRALALDGFVGPTWLDDGKVNEDGFGGGNFGRGTEANPYQIKTAGTLAYLARAVKNGNTFEGTYFVIADNINLKTEGTETVWVPIGLNTDHAFKGTLRNGTDAEGNPYVISGMTIRATGTGTTQDFGLFGVLQGTVEGLVIKNAEIDIRTTGEEFHAGALCGRFGSSVTGYEPGTVRKCTAEGITIYASSTSDHKAYSSTAVGGLMGIVYSFSDLTSSLAKASIRATGPISTGGVFGYVVANKEISDCHAVANITVSNGTTSQASAGGITGYCNNLFRYDKTKLLACTASGDIAVSGDGSHVVMGGITGYAYNLQMLEYCTTSVSLSGGHTMGGLIGFYDEMLNASSAGICECFCSSFVDGKKATYAGGLFGHLKFSNLSYSSNYWVMRMENATLFTTFAGTMTKPESSERYGIAVGYVENDRYPESFGYFKYDRQMCNLQLNGMGWGSDKRWTTASDGIVYAFDSPKPDNNYYTYYKEAWMGSIYEHLDNRESFYTDNMRVACAPFIVTNDYKAYFDAFDVTIDFLVDKFVNATTGEELATFQLVTPAPTCLKVKGNQVKLLDPGEAVIIVNCRGVQRKVHLDITYGKAWTGNRLERYTLRGSGTEKEPYVIHNVEELRYACRDEFNKEGVHFVLANDLFINNHLLNDDAEPREDVPEWGRPNWRAILHGNGKTIYGLKSVANDNYDADPLGLFSYVSGTIEDLAVVDAYVESAYIGDNISAGIICGKLLKNGSISRCMASGRVEGGSSYTGGICGWADADGTLISDCFAAVHVGSYHGAGIVGTAPERLVRCVSTSKVDDGEGITKNYSESSNATDCWYDIQMMPNIMYAIYYLLEETGSVEPEKLEELIMELENQNPAEAKHTREMTGDKIFAGNPAWHTEENRYPMLRQFVGTPYGDLLSVPVFFADNNNTECVTKIFNLPTENVVWSAKNGQKYIDIINECGAGAPCAPPLDGFDGYTECLVAQTASLQSESTRAKHIIELNVWAQKAGIQFKDADIKAACLAAFDDDDDGLITLREAFEADADKFRTFNTNENASAAQSFTELRYFAGITDLKEDMLSGLSNLSELELPNVLTTISPNAFRGCSSLAEVTLPHTVTTANGESFYGSAIKDIYVNSHNPQLLSIDGALYQTDRNDDTKVMLMAYPPSRGEESATLSVPLSVIGSKAFYKVPDLNNIYIDNCLPEGNMAVLSEPKDAGWENSDAIIHEGDDDDTDEPRMHIYVNDGSFNSKLFEEYSDDYDWGLYKENNRLDIYYPLNVTSALWATLYIDFDTELPEGLTAYIASEPDTLAGIVELNSIGRKVPHSTPVAIKAEQPGIYPLYKYHESLPSIEMYNNRFIGSFIGQDDRFGVPVNQETANEGSMLTLGRNRDGQVGFFKYNGEEIPPYRAYLTRNNIIEGPTSLMVKIGRDLTTEIAEVIGTRQQQVPAVYTIDGRRVPVSSVSAVPSLPKGIYIVNGKKVAIK